jgi:predicted acylesterase/phospholipase RssA
LLTGEEIYVFFRRWLAVARLRVNARAEYAGYLSAAGNDVRACFRMLANVVRSGADATLTRYRDDNLTFEAFEREFRVQLAVTGTNLETLTSHVFSAATTPLFSVVDAVRLSMSLPYCIFKPLIIREDDPLLPRVLGAGERLRERDPVSNNHERHPLVGVWVDGGLFNNIPSHVFDREARGGETLSLRLDSNLQTLPVAVNDITDYYRRFPGGLLFGSGEALASRSYDNKYRSIALDTGDLGLLSFSPSAAEAAAVRRSAVEYVFRYFDRPIPQDL